MNYRKQLIRIVTFLGGIYYFLEFVLPATVAGVQIDAYHQPISQGFIAIGSVAVGLGIINLFMVHGSRILFNKPGWSNSGALLVGLLAMAFVTCLDWHDSSEIAGEAERIIELRDFAERIVSDKNNGTSEVLPYSERIGLLKSAGDAALDTLSGDLGDLDSIIVSSNDPEQAAKLKNSYELLKLNITKTQKLLKQSSFVEDSELENLGIEFGKLSAAYREVRLVAYEHSLTSKLYKLFFDGFFVALGSAMFSLLGFYIASAAYRAFRIRSAESGFMLLAAILVMLGQIPFGLWIWDAFPDIRSWLLTVPNTGAFRAIRIGAAVAGLVMAFRMWFSIESEYVKEEGA